MKSLSITLWGAGGKPKESKFYSLIQHKTLYQRFRCIEMYILNKRLKSTAERLIHKRGASLFFVSLILIISSSPIYYVYPDFGFLIQLFSAIIIIGTAYYASTNKLSFFIISALVSIWFALQPIFNLRFPSWLPSLTMTAILTIILYISGKKLISSTEVCFETIISTIAGYFIISGILAYVYFFIDVFDKNSFLCMFHIKFNENVALYYSLETITTLGFSSIIPISPFVRVLSSFEAAIGQFYIAIVIARFVTLLPPPSRKH